MGSQQYTEDDKEANRKAGEVFHKKLDIWMKHGNGRVLINGKPVKRTQSSFGKMIYPDMKKPQSQISKWYNAKLSHTPPRIPEDKLNKMIEIFNNDGIPTTRDEFKIHNGDEREYNEQYMTNWIKDHYVFRSDIHFANIDSHYKRLFSFMRYIKDIPNYDEFFPLWTPIVIKEKVDDPFSKLSQEEINEMWESSSGVDLPIFQRDSYINLPNTASSDYPEFQIDKKEDGIKTLQEADIDFINKVEQLVRRYIISLFLDHKKELDNTDNINKTYYRNLSHIAPDRDSMIEVIKNNGDLTKLHLELADKDQFEYYYYQAEQSEENKEGVDK